MSTEINFIGNLVGSYTDLSELMVLAAQGKVDAGDFPGVEPDERYRRGDRANRARDRGHPGAPAPGQPGSR